MEGYRTYVLAVLLMATGVLHSLGYLPNEVAVSLYGIIAPLLGITLRKGSKNDAEKVKEEIREEYKELKK